VISQRNENLSLWADALMNEFLCCSRGTDGASQESKAKNLTIDFVPRKRRCLRPVCIVGFQNLWSRTLGVSSLAESAQQQHAQMRHVGASKTKAAAVATTNGENQMGNCAS
jgi:hypothetical protein